MGEPGGVIQQVARRDVSFRIMYLEPLGENYYSCLVCTIQIHCSQYIYDHSSHPTNMSSCGRSLFRCCCVTLPIFLYDGVRLLLYTLVLSPAFVRFAWYYFVVADRVVVKYGRDSVRQTLDVYRPVTSVTTHDDDAASRERALLEHDHLPHLPATDPGRHCDRRSDISLQGPIVFFCCGGAWMIGYKMWGALLARVLTAAGLTVVVPDYRNYPWGCIPQQVSDVEAALQWTFDHCAETTASTTTVGSTVAASETSTMQGRYQGCNIVVVGQSAGGHLLLTLMLRKAVEQLHRNQPRNAGARSDTHHSLPIDTLQNETADPTVFVPNDVRGIMALSAPLNLSAMQNTFRKHGLDEHLVDRMFDGLTNEYDPFVILSSASAPCTEVVGVQAGAAVEHPQNTGALADYLPPIKIYHGSRDKTVPVDGSVAFTEQLQAHNCAATFHMYEGWSHTDPILEGPMDADHRFHRDIFDSVVEWSFCTSADDFGRNDDTSSAAALVWPGEPSDNVTMNPHTPTVMRRLCPHIMVQAGRLFMPF
jgi:prenylcysteine alpha-carboxyl methylesterase